jgi:cytochrome c-type biogenesis protein CcmH
MPNVSDDDRSMLLIEDHAPVADTQSCATTALKSLHIALPGPRKLLKAGVDALSDVWCELESLRRRGRRKGYRLHGAISHYAILSVNALFVVLVTLMLVSTPAFAVQPDEILKDPVLEARARALSQHLRCMVCQNQSIDDSDAPLARDLRILVRERLSAGDSDSQVIDFLVARYGEFVLLKPPFNWHTALLWIAPFAIIVIGALAFLAAGRRRNSASAERLSAEEEARVAALVKRD